MRHPSPFMPGLTLGQRFYEEVGRPVIERAVAPQDYAAALVGKGSDVLGFDAEPSTDHDWGPRFQVFLPRESFEGAAQRLDAELSAGLPRVFLGYEVGFQEEGGAPLPHRVEITTLQDWLQRHLAVDHVTGLRNLDWLTFPEQRLLEVTSGRVFHDPRGELGRVREALQEYPRDVWLYRMACQWQRLAQAEGFVGRCAQAGDSLGMRLLAARLVRDIMKLCFLMERRYAPYDKWLGTAFAQLACSSSLLPLLSSVLDATEYAVLEPRLAEAYRRLGQMHGALGLTGPLDESPRRFFSRPYVVMGCGRFANALLRAVQDEELRGIPVRAGGIDQLIDATDFLETPAVYRRLLDLLRPKA